MKHYNKLVRDRIPQIIEAQGQVHDTITLDEQLFVKALKEKLQEELNEFLEAEEVLELADMLEVIYALAAVKGVSRDELERLRLKKAQQNGGFGDRLFLKTVMEK
ncbi:nucleoside triphosphate pyrophosphohydrolase [Paenibacillus sp. 481]|uniref:nucleoside triphosphate pyrophosphohydrolase n=1 Tax=Paenibacillus sp. 481 TaxID=2835869 RepID=UPI001E3FCDC2|nr:nucleoside triphosphate pyrophosphohydrolase [Paenibacillus sp. 481]UHA73690.1 nucleoside triphosphate pyrophosphohydrolase [Paenibacillus sp. 481]